MSVMSLRIRGPDVVEDGVETAASGPGFRVRAAPELHVSVMRGLRAMNSFAIWAEASVGTVVDDDRFERAGALRAGRVSMLPFAKRSALYGA